MRAKLADAHRLREDLVTANQRLQAVEQLLIDLRKLWSGDEGRRLLDEAYGHSTYTITL